jgi:hypothetical protein
MDLPFNDLFDIARISFPDEMHGNNPPIVPNVDSLELLQLLDGIAIVLVGGIHLECIFW